MAKSRYNTFLSPNDVQSSSSLRRKVLEKNSNAILEDYEDFDEDEESFEYDPLYSSQLSLNDQTPLLSTCDIPVPVDKGKLVGFVFCYLGMSTMLPWNFLISVTTFWDYKFRNVTLDYMPRDEIPPTDIQISFPSYLAIASNVPGAITTLAHSAFGQRFSVRTRIFWSLSILFSTFVTLLALSLPNSDFWQAKFLHVVLIVVVLTNVGVNVLQGSMFGVSGRFPSVYAGFVMTGQALGGVVPAAAAIGFTSLDIKPGLLGPACFGCILAFIGVGILLYIMVNKNLFFLYYGEGQSSENSVVNHDAEVDQLCYKVIVKRSWTYFLTGFLNYATSLCVFPAITSLVESQRKSAWSDQYFTPLASVLLFNFGDLLGRSLATWLMWPRRNKFGRYLLLTVTILRIGLIPLIMSCNASPETRQHLPVLFESDAVFCLLIAVLSISNGYIGSICMINCPKRMKLPFEREAASILTNSMSSLGIATGFVPMFMFTNAAPSHRHLPVIFNSDLVFCILVFFLALSVGYTGNLCLIQTPKRFHAPANQEATSLMLTAVFVLGQASGSFLSFVVINNL